MLRSSIYRNDVDGLRAVAVISVVLFHFKFSFIEGGFVGVDIFFVISGFVIARTIRSDLEAGRFSVFDFYFKRIRRIMPALVVVALTTAFFSLFILLPSDLVDFSKSLSSISAFISNFYFWKTSGYFSAAAETKPLLHTWSLSVEEQYYVFAPLLFASIHKYGRNRWIVWLMPLVCISFAISLAAVFIAPTAGFFLIPSRVWELLLGAILALRNRTVAAGPRLSMVMAWSGLALIAYGVFQLEETDPFPGWYAIFPCLGAALVIEAGMLADASAKMPLVNRLLATKPFVGIGRISYSLYLVHWPLIALLRYRLLRDPTPFEGSVLTIMSLGLAWLSWRFVEQPFRHIGVERRKTVLAAGVCCIVAGIGLGGGLSVTGGLPQRFPDFVEQSVPGVEQWGGNACFNQDPTKPSAWSPVACRRIAGSNGHILLWGDSFAAHYAPGLIASSSRLNSDVYQYTFAGCPPILAYYSLARRGCSVFNAEALSVIQDLKIDTVVLSARWSEVPKVTLGHLHETVQMLLERGLRVVVFGPSPQFAVDVQRLDYLSGRSKLPGEVEAPTTSQVDLSKKIEDESRGATYVNPLAVLCKETVCPYREGRTFFYSDYGHFSTAGSTRAVEAYFPVGKKMDGN